MFCSQTAWVVLLTLDANTLGKSSSAVAGEGKQGTIAAPLNFGLSESCRKVFLLSEAFRPELQNLGPRNLYLEAFRAKLKS